jgi:hypothetical protein
MGCQTPTIVMLKASDIIPITKFCMAIKLINNTKSNSVGIKSLSGSCDLKIQDKAGSMIIISIDEGSYKFFADLYEISCEFMGEGNYVNCIKYPKKFGLKTKASMKQPRK